LLPFFSLGEPCLKMQKPLELLIETGITGPSEGGTQIETFAA
jgi:hypothetical protein